MSIAALITQGIGPGGSVPYLLTGGLDLGAAPVVTRNRGGFLPYRKGERRARGLEWQRRKDIAEHLEEVYARLYGPLQEVAEPTAIREAVAEHARPSDAPIPPVQAIDFSGLAADLANAERLLALYAAAVKRKADMDDDEDAVIAMLLT